MSLKITLRDTAHALIGNAAYEWIMMWRKLDYWPHLRNPRTFNEKICHRKLYNQVPNSVMLADKWRVQQYVEKKVGKHILNKVLFVGDNPDEIPYAKLPSKFVVRFNHTSGTNIFVTDKSKMPFAELKKRCAKGLKDDFGYGSNEHWYLDMKRVFIIEEYMVDKKYGVAPDFKFFIFSGKIKLIQVDYARFGNHGRRIYTADWKPTDIRIIDPSNTPLGKPTPPPAKLEEMKKIALKLAGKTDFLRVDLYLLDGKTIRFGEITLCPSAGWKPMTPKGIDMEIGSWWK